MLFTITAAATAFVLQASATAPEAQVTAASVVEATTADAAAAPNQTVAAATNAADKITDKNHPDYMRCRSDRVIGSLAKRKKTCMTNREWEAAARTGNRGARDIVESQQVGMNGQ